jgi:uncharacterized protein (UPF0264 family)
MTQLLVSVRNEHEAKDALRGGADWIDLKEPARGALGCVHPDVAARVVAAVGDLAPISAAAGELSDWTHLGPAVVYAVPGVKLLKLGLACQKSHDWKPAWLAIQQAAEKVGQELVPVIYADFKMAQSSSPADVINLLSETTCPWVLIDTFNKAAGSLLDHFDRPALADLLDSIRQRGKRTVVAGRLTLECIQTLPLELIDVVAVRGAACRGDRNGTIGADRVAQLRSRLSRLQNAAARER